MRFREFGGFATSALLVDDRERYNRLAQAKADGDVAAQAQIYREIIEHKRMDTYRVHEMNPGSDCQSQSGHSSSPGFAVLYRSLRSLPVDRQRPRTRK